MKEKGVSISEEWANCLIFVPASNPESRDSKLSLLRSKICKHFESASHQISRKIKVESRLNILPEMSKKSVSDNVKKTNAVFRTAYYCAKRNRPFTDHEALIELQVLNGVDCGEILHSRYSSTSITNSIANDMKKRIISNIILNTSKISVIIDESTTLSNKSALAIHLKTDVTMEHTSIPEFVFLALVELDSQTSDSVTTGLLKTLADHGFDDNFLERN